MSYHTHRTVTDDWMAWRLVVVSWLIIAVAVVVLLGLGAVVAVALPPHAAAHFLQLGNWH